MAFNVFTANSPDRAGHPEQCDRNEDVDPAQMPRIKASDECCRDCRDRHQQQIYGAEDAMIFTAFPGEENQPRPQKKRRYDRRKMNLDRERLASH